MPVVVNAHHTRLRGILEDGLRGVAPAPVKTSWKKTRRAKNLSQQGGRFRLRHGNCMRGGRAPCDARKLTPS